MYEQTNKETKWLALLQQPLQRIQICCCYKKKHGKTIYTGRLTWNLQINHLERKMIFQTSMIMFPVNLQGCNTNVFLVMLPFPRLEGHATFRILSTNGDRIDIGSIAAGESRECWGGKKKKKLEGPKSISPQVHICVGSVFFGWQATIIFSFLLHKNYKTPKKIRKGCWEKLLQPLLSSSDIAWYDLGGSCWVSNRELRQVVTHIAVSQSCINQLLMNLFRTYSNLTWCLGVGSI